MRYRAANGAVFLWSVLAERAAFALDEEASVSADVAAGFAEGGAAGGVMVQASMGLSGGPELDLQISQLTHRAEFLYSGKGWTWLTLISWQPSYAFRLGPRAALGPAVALDWSFGGENECEGVFGCTYPGVAYGGGMVYEATGSKGPDGPLLRTYFGVNTYCVYDTCSWILPRLKAELTFGQLEVGVELIGRGSALLYVGHGLAWTE